MRQYMGIFEKCALFSGISKEDLSALLTCLGGNVVEYAKNQWIFSEGDSAKSMGILLSGCVQVVKDDYLGNRTIVNTVEPGGLFGESFACAEVDHMPVGVVATCPCKVLLVNCNRLLTTCSNSCEFHSRMIQNLVHILAQSNILLNQKIEVTSHRSTREKLMAYLLSEAKKQQNHQFTIPFDRQELADYLGVERSAMSAEIGKMKKEGLLDTKKSWFQIY